MYKSKHTPRENDFAELLKSFSPEQLQKIANIALAKANAPKQHNRYVADKVNSTFWWEIEMNYDQKVNSIVGYCKFEGFNEGRNKDDVLCKRVEMLYKNGYMHRSKCITFYRRMGAICSRELDQVVLVITPDNWDYREATTEYRSISVELFISNFINTVKNGIAPKVHLRPIIKPS